VNQEDSEQNEVDRIKKGAYCTTNIQFDDAESSFKPFFLFSARDVVLSWS